MEIRDPIHGTLHIHRSEVQVLDTPALQRLRMIKQLGFAEFSFPGATHSRYLHSLGVAYIAGESFDAIFKNFDFSSSEVRTRFRQTLRLAALLHDIGHGPLSHSTEEVMPMVEHLSVGVYENKKGGGQKAKRRANHEDYTIKFITDSHLTEVLRKTFPDIEPYHISCLIDKELMDKDDFFMDGGLNFRTILSQIVSSEVDADRMDYLERDAYFCGTNYGKVELGWLLNNFTYHIVNDQVFLALNRRALYTFDDFLLSRHHMHLMVYFHHKSIIYEEMLYRYLTSSDCDYALPPDIEQYVSATDYSLYNHIATSDNPWAKRISERRSYKVLFENHVTNDSPRVEKVVELLEKEGIDNIMVSSKTRLSKYHGAMLDEDAVRIYVVDSFDPNGEPITVDKCTEIFQKYENARTIERVYVSPENFSNSKTLLQCVTF